MNDMNNNLKVEHIKVSDIKIGDTVIIAQNGLQTMFYVDEIDDNTMWDEYVYIVDNEQWEYVLVSINDNAMRISQESSIKVGAN